MKNILEIELKSSFKYQVIFFISALMHTVFLITFMSAKLYVLMTLNIASVAFYLIAGIVSRFGDIEKHGSAWLCASYAEITGHAFICTLWLGFEPCFYLYAIIVLMVAAYVLYLACDKRQFLKLIVIFAAITLASMLFCLIYLNYCDTILSVYFKNELEKQQIALMRAINLLFNIIITFFFSVMFIVEIQVLIRKLNTANERLNYTAMHDTLTGLYNRRSLYKMYEEMKDKGNFCVVMGDIDNFKKINDTYGHGCGDDVLKGVSSIMSELSKDDDIACRWGGEEFLLVIAGTKENCLARLNEIRDRIIALEINHNGKKINVTMTFGFVDCLEILQHTEFINPSVNIDALVQIADTRLYYGKENGKNVIIDKDVEILTVKEH